MSILERNYLLYPSLPYKNSSNCVLQNNHLCLLFSFFVSIFEFMFVFSFDEYKEMDEN